MENSANKNSTQRLLDVIRSPEITGPKVSVSNTSHRISQLVKLKAVKKNSLNLGVFFTQTTVTFALVVGKGSNKKKSLIKWANVTIPENLDFNDDGFPAFLEINLNKFIEGQKKISIWCVIDSSHLKLRNIVVPAVAQSKIANVAFWGLKKEMDFDAEQEIFDFYVSGNTISEGVKKKKIITLLAKKEKIESLNNLFLKTGHKLKGITALPCAIKNYIYTSNLQVDDSPFTIVYLSTQHSELFCFSGSDILLSRTIRTSLYSLVEDKAKSSDISVMDYLASIQTFKNDDFSEIQQSCERLINKIVSTSQYCSQNFSDNKPMKKFIVFGEVNECEPFMDLVKETIPVSVEKFNPVFDNLPGTIESGLPDNIFERSNVLTAFGVALSSNDYTPNFLNTYQNKEKKVKEKKVNIMVATTFVLLFFLCVGISNWQKTTIKKEQNKLNTLVQQKNTFSSDISLETTIKLIAGAKNTLMLQNRYFSDYLPLAVINEVCSLTPQNISIESFKSRYNDQEKSNKASTISPGITKAKIEVTGTVDSKENTANADLAEYILTLGSSNIFENIEIVKKNLDTDGENKALNFKLTMDVL